MLLDESVMIHDGCVEQRERDGFRVVARENPWVLDRGPSDHDAVAAGFFDHAFGFGETPNVSVPKDRDRQARFQRRDCVPIDLAFEKLLAGTGVERDERGALIRADLPDFEIIDRCLVPAKPDFRGNRTGQGYWPFFTSLVISLSFFLESLAPLGRESPFL